MHKINKVPTQPGIPEHNSNSSSSGAVGSSSSNNNNNLNATENPITTSASAPSVPNPPPRKSTSPTKDKDNPTKHQQQQPQQVRHIPIFVEGRDAPVLSSSTNRKSSSDKVPNPPVRNSSRPNTLNTSSVPLNTEPTSPLSPPPGPIPMGCSPHLNKDAAAPSKAPAEEPTSPQPMPPGPIPLPNLSDTQQQQQQQQPEVSNDAPDSTKDTSSESDSIKSDPALDKVKSIQDKLQDIKKRIEDFKGSKTDKEYLYLDDLLTRYLLQLDCIDSGGREEIRKIRKESIVSVNRCLSLLDHRAKSNAESNDEILSKIQAESNAKDNKKSESPAAVAAAATTKVDESTKK